jgi:hypothetical protein
LALAALQLVAFAGLFHLLAVKQLKLFPAWRA